MSLCHYVRGSTMSLGRGGAMSLGRGGAMSLCEGARNSSLLALNEQVINGHMDPCALQKHEKGKRTM